jgi:hypothetical protein
MHCDGYQNPDKPMGVLDLVIPSEESPLRQCWWPGGPIVFADG